MLSKWTFVAIVVIIVLIIISLDIVLYTVFMSAENFVLMFIRSSDR
jgi:hypothetical protein